MTASEEYFSKEASRLYPSFLSSQTLILSSAEVTVERNDSFLTGRNLQYQDQNGLLSVEQEVETD